MNVTTPAPPVPTREAAERRFLLPHVGWQCYEALLAGIGNRRSIRVTYDRGNVELMSPLFEHETYGAVLAIFVEVALDEWNITYKSAGSTTLRRPDLERGLEADRSYYIANVGAIRGRRTLDLQFDPPPDLAIEVEVTRSALDRMGVYAALGVPEVWRCDGDALFVHRLNPDGVYAVVDFSPTFPAAPLAELMNLVRQLSWEDDPVIRRAFRAWIRERLLPPQGGSEAGPASSAAEQ
jgi:Uma2 family endonuclease